MSENLTMDTFEFEQIKQLKNSFPIAVKDVADCRGETRAAVAGASLLGIISNEIPVSNIPEIIASPSFTPSLFQVHSNDSEEIKDMCAEMLDPLVTTLSEYESVHNLIEDITQDTVIDIEVNEGSSHGDEQFRRAFESHESPTQSRINHVNDIRSSHNSIGNDVGRGPGPTDNSNPRGRLSTSFQPTVNSTSANDRRYKVRGKYAQPTIDEDLENITTADSINNETVVEN